MRFQVSFENSNFFVSIHVSFKRVSQNFCYIASYFIRRKTLYCRIINVTKVEDRHLRVQGDSDTYSRAIQVSVRHLSPIGQILPKTWFDFFMKMNPLTARLAREKSKERPEEVKTELLQVELGA